MSDEWIELKENFPYKEGQYEKIFGQRPSQAACDELTEAAKRFVAKLNEHDPDKKFDQGYDKIDWSKK